MEEVRHLGAAVIADQRALAILVHALARIVMLVEGGAVEAAEARAIDGEMSRHPIQQHH